MPSTKPTRVLAGVQVIDTPIVTSAIDFARTHLHDVAFNHVMRSWLWGVLIISKSPNLKDSTDLEIHALANILHDMGWSSSAELISTDKRFEVDGANVARDFVKKSKHSEEWDGRRTQLVWDAIALHSSPSIAAYKENEVHATTRGVFSDFSGPDHSQSLITWDEWNAVKAEFPRTNFKEGVGEAMCHLCKTKPETTYDNFVGEFGDGTVEGYTLKGHRTSDVLMGFLNALNE